MGGYLVTPPAYSKSDFLTRRKYMKWFRLYNDILEDPKVQNLSPELFKFWINILCLASKNKGKLPPIEDIAFALRMSKSETEAAFHSIKKAHLIDEKSNQHGTTIAPHNWNKRQYKSDTSTERVKRFRNAKKTVTETPPESDQNRYRTDTESRPDILNFDIERLLDDKSREAAKKKAPGWDLYYLIPIFNKWITEKPFPDNPAGAFINWCGTYTKGRQL